MAKGNSKGAEPKAEPQAADPCPTADSRLCWTPAHSSEHPRPTGRAALLCLLLVALVIWAFLPVLGNGFVNFDDTFYVYENLHVQGGLTWESIRWAFTTLEAGFWHPLTWLSIMLDCQLFGLRAGGHHLTSLLLHAANTVLVFLVFRRMTDATWRSVFVAALFGLHPLHVESVAWAAERKDVLSTLFWLLTMLMYLRYAEERKGRGQRLAFNLPSPIFYLLALLFFICGLMSKIMIVTLPFMFLLLDWWPLQRLQINPQNSTLKTLRPLLLEKLPFLIAVFCAGLLAVHAEKAAGAYRTAAQAPLPPRIANALLSYVRYLAQAVWPSDLAVYYPYPHTFSFWPVLGAALVLLVSVIVLRAVRSRPYLTFGWVWFVVTLLPVIGLIQLGGQARADRYTYLPLIGVFTALTWGACDLTQRWRYRAPVLSGVAAAVILVCILLTRQQVIYWKDSEALFRHALAVTQDNDLARSNLGSALITQGRFEEAVGHLREALRLAPAYPEAHNNLGAALMQKGQLDEAIGHFQTALRLKSDFPQAYCNLGVGLARQGRLDEAISALQEGLNLALGDAEARHQLAIALARKGLVVEAIVEFQKVVDRQPTNAAVQDSLAGLLLRQGREDQALVHFQKAAQIDPTLLSAHRDLGNLLLRRGAVDEAMLHYRRALAIQPTNVVILNNLAWVLATSPKNAIRSGAKAIELAEQAERLSGGRNPSVLETLAAAYAEAGRFPAAVTTAQRALELATSQTNQAQMESLQAQIELYRSGAPFRDRSQPNAAGHSSVP
jgi:protein O-mannosyl-transferase